MSLKAESVISESNAQHFVLIIVLLSMGDNNNEYISFKNNRFHPLTKKSQFVMSENHFHKSYFPFRAFKIHGTWIWKCKTNPNNMRPSRFNFHVVLYYMMTCIMTKLSNYVMAGAFLLFLQFISDTSRTGEVRGQVLQIPDCCYSHGHKRAF